MGHIQASKSLHHLVWNDPKANEICNQMLAFEHGLWNQLCFLDEPFFPVTKLQKKIRLTIVEKIVLDSVKENF